MNPITIVIYAKINTHKIFRTALSCEHFNALNLILAKHNMCRIINLLSVYVSVRNKRK